MYAVCIFFGRPSQTPAQPKQSSLTQVNCPGQTTRDQTDALARALRMLLAKRSTGGEADSSRGSSREMPMDELDGEAGWQGLSEMGGSQPGILHAQQHAFYMHVVHQLLRRASQGPPTVLSFWPGPHELHRRTELFRSDALRRFGFSVRECVYAQDQLATLLRPGGREGGSGEGQGGGGAPDVEFIIMAKPTVAFLREVRRLAQDVPLYIWTWDLIDYEQDESRRSWFEQAIPLVDAAFLNEVGREDMWRAYGG